MGDFEFYAELRDEADKAWLVFDGINKVWLPKSKTRIEMMSDNVKCMITVPEWLAKEKGVI